MLRKLVLKLIRKANKKDIIYINEMGNKLHNNFEANFHMESEINNDISIVLISESDKIVGGYLFAQDFLDNIDLLSIYVDENKRNKHIGTELLKYLVDNYTFNNKTITLEVAEDNIPALNFYKKFGFEIVNERKNYYGDKSAYLMKWGIK